jgi:class 3 adenylate cyclase
MPRLRVKSFDAPDESREIPRARYANVQLGETVVAYATFDPGWRWSTDLGPLMRASTCPVHHLGYAVSGVCHVVLEDGEEANIGPGQVYAIPPGHDAWVVGDEPWVTIEWQSGRPISSMLETSGERVVASILFTDIVDSTSMLETLGDARWRDLLLDHNRAIRAQLNMYRGREITTTGDGFLAVFDGATRAARCGVAMATAVRGLGISIRVGIHTGELEFVGEDARGVAVHAAARVMAQAEPGEVLVSSTTADLLEGSGLELVEAGTHELRGLTGPRRLFRVLAGEGSRTR